MEFLWLAFWLFVLIILPILFIIWQYRRMDRKISENRQVVALIESFAQGDMERQEFEERRKELLGVEEEGSDEGEDGGDTDG